MLLTMEQVVGKFLSSGTTSPRITFSAICWAVRLDFDMQVNPILLSLLPTEWQAEPHSRRGILEKQNLSTASTISWWCSMHSPEPERDSERTEEEKEEEERPLVGLLDNLTHLSVSLPM